eukprot:364999-Chlamydomonas_euryale.AAC.16
MVEAAVQLAAPLQEQLCHRPVGRCGRQVTFDWGPPSSPPVAALPTDMSACRAPVGAAVH